MASHVNLAPWAPPSKAKKFITVFDHKGNSCTGSRADIAEHLEISVEKLHELIKSGELKTDGFNTSSMLRHITEITDNFGNRYSGTKTDIAGKLKIKTDTLNRRISRGQYKVVTAPPSKSTPAGDVVAESKSVITLTDRDGVVYSGTKAAISKKLGIKVDTLCDRINKGQYILTD